MATDFHPGILIADDNPSIRLVLTRLLQENGFQTWVSENGREAIDLYHLHQRHISLVLLDVDMPELDGLEAAAAIHACNPEIPCCLMTGGGSFSPEDLNQFGVLDLFQKPFSPATIVSRLQELVHRPQAVL